MASIARRPDGRWRARYRDGEGREHARHFTRKVEGQRWLDEQTSKIVTGTHIAPRLAKTTVGEWADLWLAGYRTRKPSTVRQAETHLKRIKAAFGGRQLGSVRPSEVKTWCASLADEGLATSYVYAIHGRLVQIYADAIEDGYVARSPASRKTSPPMGTQRPFVATTQQVWGLYDAVPLNIQPAILLGAFVGFRTAEVCGTRVRDIDFMRGIVHPTVQYPAEDLKTETSRTPVPIPRSLALQLAAHVETLPEAAEYLLVDQWQHQLTPRTLQRAVDRVRRAHADPLPEGHEQRCVGCLVPGLPPEFHFHDLRHYLASMLIASGADVKVVQKRLRHASAKTTLDTYAHLWPDSDDSTRVAIDGVMTARAEARADSVRTQRKF